MSQSHFLQGRNLWIMRYCKACNWVSLVQQYGSFLRAAGIWYLNLIKHLYMAFVDALLFAERV